MTISFLLFHQLRTGHMLPKRLLNFSA